MKSSLEKEDFSCGRNPTLEQGRSERHPPLEEEGAAETAAPIPHPAVRRRRKPAAIPSRGRRAERRDVLVGHFLAPPPCPAVSRWVTNPAGCHRGPSRPYRRDPPGRRRSGRSRAGITWAAGPRLLGIGSGASGSRSRSGFSGSDPSGRGSGGGSGSGPSGHDSHSGCGFSGRVSASGSGFSSGHSSGFSPGLPLPVRLPRPWGLWRARLRREQHRQQRDPAMLRG